MIRIIATTILLSLFATAFSQDKKHAFESEIITASPVISLLGKSKQQRISPNLFYTYKFNPNYKLVIGGGYQDYKYESPCPGNYCWGDERKKVFATLGLRRNLWLINKNMHLYGEFNILYESFNENRWGAGGISGARTEYDRNGYGLGSITRLGLEYNIRKGFYVSLNSSLTISNQWYDQRTISPYPVLWPEQLETLYLYSNIVGIRLGYKFK